MPSRKRKASSAKIGKQAADSTGWEALDDVKQSQLLKQDGDGAEQPKSYSKAFLLIFAVVSSLALYINTLSNEFVYDDLVAVVQNPDVRGERPVSILFKADFWGGVLADPKSHKSYRPVTTLLYRITAAMAGMEPRAFHMVNSVVNAVAVGLAVKGTEIVAYDTSKSGKAVYVVGLSLPTFALVATALYAFHPIHTESVNCIVGLADLIAAAFGFLAFIYHDKSRTCGDRTGTRDLLACMVFSWLSALAKEPGLMILAVCGAREVALYWLPSLRDTPMKSTVLVSSIVRFGFLASTGVAFLLFRKYINGENTGLNLGDSICDNPLVTAETTLSYVLSASFVVAMYVWKLINPFVLLCDYGYNSIPLIESFGDMRNLATFGAIAGVAALTLVGIRDAMDKDRPDGRILVALAWIFVPLLPASHIMTIGTVLAERLLYLPSLGYCMLLAILAERLQIGPGATKKGKIMIGAMIVPVLVIVLALFAQRIISRNRDWKDNRTLWNTDTFTNPANVKLAKAYAGELELAGKLDDAYHVIKNVSGLGAYQRVEVCLVKSRLTAMSSVSGRNYELGYQILDDCIEEVESLPKMTTNSHQLYGSKGYLLHAQGRVQEAVPHFERAAFVAEKVDKKNLQPVCNVGEVYGSVKRWEDAVSFLESCVAWGERAREVKEKRAPALANLGLAYTKTGQYEKAKAALKKSLSLHQTEQAVANLQVLHRAIEAQRKNQEGAEDQVAKKTAA
mmetsp:Transcript_9389/g.19172  ORF Transcript_9389/g.19172 Transcript_9389/m.19172 type:complete len:736 (+) Transcript_9389:493-2700(+)